MLRGVEGTTRNKLLAGVLIALAATLLSLLFGFIPITRAGLSKLDDVFYDWFYPTRPTESRQEQPIVILAIDDNSLAYLDKELKWPWPWPRDGYGLVIQWLEKAGAKAVVVDLRFTETSIHTAMGVSEDDVELARIVDAAKIPVILANHYENGKPEHTAPPFTHPDFGATNVVDARVIRKYPMMVQGTATLAKRAVERAGMTCLVRDDPFQLRYFGPHTDKKGQFTYRYIPIGKAVAMRDPKNNSLSANDVKGKIVLIGALASGTIDIKESPLSSIYPGVEVHATAIDNMINGDQVHVIAMGWQIGVALMIALASAIGIVLPRSANVKIVITAICMILAIGLPLALFRGSTIHFLPPAALLLTLSLSTIAGFVFSYQIEDR